LEEDCENGVAELGTSNHCKNNKISYGKNLLITGTEANQTTNQPFAIN
jgi:hypothetical protein